MPSEVEELLAKHQRAFAAYENFLRTGPELLSPSSQQQRWRWRRADLKETALNMRKHSELDAYGSGVSDGDHNEERLEESYSRNGHTSPAARALAAMAASAASATAVARAIAAHGDWPGTTYDDTSLRMDTPPPLQRRSTTPWLTHHTRTASATPPASHRRTSAGEIDHIEELIGERLRTAGRYRLTSAPDAIYIKSQAWALRRHQLNEALRREQEDAQLRECTFSPSLRHTAMRGTRVVSAMRRSGSGHSHSAEAAVEPSVTEDPGVLQHVARLEEARRRRRESATRFDGSRAYRWTGQPTVPREFQLGLRMAEPIRSLRKPYMPPTSSGGGGLTAASTPRVPRDKLVEGAPTARCAVQRRRSPSFAPPSSGEGREPAPVPATTSAVTLLRNSEPVQPRGQEREWQTRQPPPSTTAVLPETSETLSPIAAPQRLFAEADAQDLACELRDQLAHKVSAIEGQMEGLERLSRELDAVMETLRNIPSLGTSQ
ncbi:hypothetical protein LSCM1_06847 [Leishmania martiniquensis]|uniref:Uncharacterized protein n=1 Tax=Leishmania martiniquensis TaxID=1580590 RepID=A0A836GIV7_9TRYP|nr:hypothetical protein LSCM1_06847 [Leishmania martiniquensis]